MASISCKIAGESKPRKDRHHRLHRKSTGQCATEPTPASSREYTNSADKREVYVSTKEATVEVEESDALAECMDVEEEDVEMSEEMVAFFRKTIEHRKQRDAARAEREQRFVKERGEEAAHWIQLDDDEYILADKIGVYGVEKRTFDAPDEEAKTKKRREDAQKMYGSSAERILAMETLIDMRFEQEYANKRPPLWPNIPLKL
ncbi:hypothetical protein Q1695_014896 [Nippostrongylus brasiliensis]|nr:hypothetical protein Q1695_014896 [Nippostrongylus brasiliensis]